MRTPSDAAREGAEAGFTLVELLVALSLMALIAAWLSGSFAILSRTAALTDAMEAASLMEAVETHLRRNLEAAVSVLDAGEDGRRAVAFEGEAERVRFVTPSEGRLEAGGLVEVEIRSRDDAPGSGPPAIDEARRPWRGPESGAPHLLLEDAGLRLRYFGASGPAAAPAWHEAWARADALPLAVEVTLTPNDAPARRFSVALPAAR